MRCSALIEKALTGQRNKKTRKIYCKSTTQLDEETSGTLRSSLTTHDPTITKVKKMIELVENPGNIIVVLARCQGHQYVPNRKNIAALTSQFSRFQINQLNERLS